MDVRFRSMIDVIDSANDKRAIKKALTAYAVALGFDGFAYFQNAGSEISILTTYPQSWQDTYFSKHYSSIDPVIIEAKRRMSPFEWSADDWSSRGFSELRRFKEEAITYGIRSGVTIAVEGSFQNKALLTLSSSASRPKEIPWEDKAAAVQAVLSVYYRLKQVAKAEILVPKRMLSPREHTCLVWLAKGKYAHEIADLTGIKPRTVQHYLDEARKKLDADTQPHLVALAKDRGIV